MGVARTIASKSPLTVRGIKQVSLYNRDHPNVSDGLKHVKAWNTSYLYSEDLTEAATAMMMQKEPLYKKFWVLRRQNIINLWSLFLNRDQYNTASVVGSNPLGSATSRSGVWLIASAGRYPVNLVNHSIHNTRAAISITSLATDLNYFTRNW